MVMFVMRKFIPVAVVAAAGLSIATLPVAQGASTVSVKDDFFSPKTKTVGKGTSVKWVWKGKAPHNVTVTSGPAKFTSKTQTSGSFTKKLSKKGTYKIVCTIHPGMAMTLKVK